MEAVAGVAMVVTVALFAVVANVLRVPLVENRHPTAEKLLPLFAIIMC